VNIVHIGKDSLISSQAIIEQPENIYVGNNVQIKPGVVLRPETGFIFIGNNVISNRYTVIHARGGVEIGNWTRIGPHCGINAQRRDKQLLSLCLFLQGGTRISSFYRFNEGQML